MNRIAEVVVGLPIDKSFHYSVPADLAEEVEIGKRVWISFGQRRMVGYIVGLAESSDIKDLKEIEQVIDDEPVLDSNMLKLAKWISEYNGKKYYFCAPGCKVMFEKDPEKWSKEVD